MKINISFFLDEHGWSTCWIYKEGSVHELHATQAFPPDPIGECIQSLTDIMFQKPETSFTWYEEPGGSKTTIQEIPTKKHMVTYQVDDFSEDYGEEITIRKPIVSFEIKKVQLVRIYYYEFKKIAELMRDKHFKQNREDCFPLQEFLEFEKLAMQYIDL